MTRLALLLAVGLPAASAFAADDTGATVRRFAVVVGANRGAADRVALRYAVSDAERFADVVTRMGGVQPADELILRDPTRGQVTEALRTAAAWTAAARAQALRVELIVYFSGHADEQGLMLGRELLPYRDLRAAVSAIGADVGITILDACASGAITRLKGGQAHAAFLTGSPNEAQGYAFLTSSSEDEAAQESERLRGSFFTTALLSGLRGAADVSADGKVTLNEAYQFAFQETLAQTTTTQAGAQHPAYDIKMAGTGDVVMTDVRQVSSRLVLGEGYEGRFFVLNPRRLLVAELYKPHGRRIELGLEPGEYDVYFEQEKKLLTSTVTLVDGQPFELQRDAMKAAPRRPAQTRGFEPEPDLLDGRWRLHLGFYGRLNLLYWLNPKFALELESGDQNGAYGTVMAGGRFYPPVSGPIRPHFGLKLGRVADVYGVTYGDGVYTYPDKFGVGIGAGVDFFIGRHFTVTLDSQSTTVTDSTFINTWIGVGWVFGGPKR